VLVNLLTNAGRYGARADVIDLTVTVEHGQVWIRVVDHGEGIPADRREQIFERYVRGNGAERAALEGQGLGLHIVRTLVGLHGGTVGVESIPGSGATFWFSLPIPRAAQGGAESWATRLIEEAPGESPAR
jgi:signal transduction histidine kinase